MKESIEKVLKSNEKETQEIKEEEEDYIPFPYEVFPEDIQKLLDELEYYSQFNKDFVSISIMSCISGIIGTKYRLQYTESWEEYTNFWFCMVAKPGDKKTPIIKKVFSQLENINKDLLSLGNQVIVKSSTFEALQDVLHANKRGVISYQAEIRDWYASQTRYSNDHKSEWLNLWSMDTMIKNTRKDGTIYIERPMINIIGATQFDFASKMLSGDEDGMVERFLFTMKSDKLLLCNSGKLDISKLNDFNDNIKRLWDFTNIYNEEEIVIFPDELIEVRNNLRNKIFTFQNGLTSNKLKNYLSKLDNYIPRFILFFAFLDRYWEPDFDCLFDGTPTLIEERSGQTYYTKISDITIKQEHIDKAEKLMKYFFKSFKSLIDKTNKIKEVSRMSSALDKQVISNEEKALQMFLKGIKVPLIAKEMGISDRQIYRYIKKWKRK